MKKDYFKDKSENYDQLERRVQNVENIAISILKQVDKTKFDQTMHIMDFGSGTGLLLERISPFVKKITAVDISSSMNQQLEKKRENLGCELEILELDLSKSNLDQKFDGIISSMTMHHVQDVKSMFTKFYSLLHHGGIIAIADLELEDGSFHTEDTGVFHFGFAREALLNFAIDAGFKNVEVTLASTAHKAQGKYPVLLLTGNK